MRPIAPILAILILAACGERGERGGREQGLEPATDDHPELTAGEERTRIAATGEAPATLRSGPRIPVMLPRGFTLYPGAEVVSNTVVERGGMRRMLLVFQTPDPMEKVILYYRAEARAAGMMVAFDLAGPDRASLGGTMGSGAEVAISARRARDTTRVEFAQS